MPVSPTITLDRVTKRFDAKYALDDVAATILPGEFVAVIGKSGAGKTTLLRCLACATAVTEGSFASGRKISPRSAAQRCADNVPASG